MQHTRNASLVQDKKFLSREKEDLKILGSITSYRHKYSTDSSRPLNVSILKPHLKVSVISPECLWRVSYILPSFTGHISLRYFFKYMG